MKKWLSLIALLGIAFTSQAQCAMCRATLENNFSNGDIGIAAGINAGILYLFFAPYLAVGVIGFLWYRTSKGNEQKRIFQGPSVG
ncbi:MAG: hypothetical protein JST46_10145 [Bacteroidetes bacterium]|nr:hypothetical protein [Bacteroidota bacterium]